eukprot:9380113-Ditylum_brightwellii.AAC.1
MLLASNASVAPAVPSPNKIALDPFICEWGVSMPCLPPIKSNTCDELMNGAKSLSVNLEFALHSRITLPCFAH